jgi:DNA-binding LacI/PurR family transcriptional regulator
MPHLDSTLEKIFTGNKKSVHLMVNPRLSDVFFWHFHPEFELVFIDDASGTRHVGNHLSKYHHSDLVLIGPNIPHLNFDYGVQTSYEKRVLHFRSEFLSEVTQPELVTLSELLKESSYGLAFGKMTIDLMRDELLELQ